MAHPKPHTDRGPDSVAAPLEMPRPHGISLFWRTFFFLSLLLLGASWPGCKPSARWSLSRARCKARSSWDRW